MPDAPAVRRLADLLFHAKLDVSHNDVERWCAEIATYLVAHGVTLPGEPPQPSEAAIDAAMRVILEGEDRWPDRLAQRTTAALRAAYGAQFGPSPEQP